jgi:hypothetical protein
MSPKLSRRAQLLREHPLCCFCGGTRAAVTLDHVPPKVCFPPGLCPEGFEFPACQRCNNGTSKYDTIFGFYALLQDFNEGNRTPEDHERRVELHKQIARRYPEALPEPGTVEPVHRVGSIFTPHPVAYSVIARPVVKRAMDMIGGKLAHALYYREMKAIVTAQHRFVVAIDQIQRPGAEVLTAFLKRLLPDFRVGHRSNIKRYGSRFAYMSGCKREEDLFAFAAQFGFGLICWGMVLGPDLKSIVEGPNAKADGSNHALQKMNWRDGGNGLGAQEGTEIGCRISGKRRHGHSTI